MEVSISKFKGKRGFTLVEILFSSTLMGIGLMAVTWSHLSGLALHSKINTQLNAAAHERKLWGQLGSEVESAHKIKIGSGSRTSFTELPSTGSQIGSSIQLYPSSVYTNYFIRYYLDTDKTLKRIVSTNNVPVTLASFIENPKPFQFESSTGAVLTNSESLFIVAINFHYSQFQNNGEKIGGDNYYQYFAHSRRIAHHRGF